MTRRRTDRRGALLRIVLRLGLLIAVAWIVYLLVDWIPAGEAAIRGETGLQVGALLFFLLAYAVLISIPFVPGIEIGLALLMMEGAWVAPYVYLATVAGLMAAFCVGRFASMGFIHRLLLDLHLHRADRFLSRIGRLDQRRRVALLRRAAPRRLGSIGLRYRYVLLAVLVNMPGSGFLGGGGGLAMAAGLTGIFSTGPIFVTFAIAVAPVPLLVYAFDVHILS